MRVTVLRGISGSGKSTWAAAQPGATIVSADHYFLVDGVYSFDASKLQANHEACFRAFLEALVRKDAHIIVDNTNLAAWEYAPYVLAGQAFGYTVELLSFVCPYDVARARKKLVPDQTLRRTTETMVRETQQMPPRFKGLHKEITTC